MGASTLRMGTRGSALARAQSGAFADTVTRATGAAIEVVLVKTEGDRLSTEGRAPEGGDETGVFVRALDEALREGRIDFAVHSLKDVPTEQAPDLVLAAVPARADVRDALVVASRHREVESRESRVERDALALLPRGARVATSSPRRIAQLLRLRPDLQTVPMAGNVDTRLAKLERGEADALLLASAGLDRLGRGSVITARLSTDDFLPAPAQGALAVACLASGASGALDAVATQDDRAARFTALAERSVLSAIRGGCRAPVGAKAELVNGTLRVAARVLSLDGKEAIDASAEGACSRVEEAEALGRSVAEALLARGASRLVEAARRAGR